MKAALRVRCKPLHYYRNGVRVDGLPPWIKGTPNPQLTGEVSLDLIGEVSPQLTGTVSPYLVGTLSPDLTGELSPFLTGELNPLSRRVRAVREPGRSALPHASVPAPAALVWINPRNAAIVLVMRFATCNS